MSATPSLPEQGLLRATEAVRRASAANQAEQHDAERQSIDEAIIDVPDDLDDPERSAVVHDEADEVSRHLDVASEFDLREQSIVIPVDEDERASS